MYGKMHLSWTMKAYTIFTHYFVLTYAVGVFVSLFLYNCTHVEILVDTDLIGVFKCSKVTEILLRLFCMDGTLVYISCSRYSYLLSWQSKRRFRFIGKQFILASQVTCVSVCL